MNFRDFFSEKDFVLFDGAIGTQIYAKGVPKGHCYDELNVSMPEIIMDIHREYVDAGAEVITTNTFGSNRFILGEYYDLASKVREINYYGARIAKRIARDRAFVAGSVGPVSRPLDRERRFEDDEITEMMREQIEALLEGGVDLVVFETFSSLEELLLGIETARKVKSDLFIIAEMSFPNNGLTIFGKNSYEVALKLDASGADVIGSNCGSGPKSVYEAVRKMASVAGKDLSAMPNAGLARLIHGRLYYPYNPEYFVKYGKKFLDSGVKVLGGCCGTTPSHIRYMKESLEGLKPKRRRKRIVELMERGEARKEERVGSKLRDRLLEGGVVSVEVDPPRDPDFEGFIRKIETFSDYVDAINVSDSPMARPRMSPISAGKLLKDHLGKEIVVHYTCRDRNILGIQSDLLGASALGLENFLAIGGDPPSIGDYPFATGVYDLTAEGLVGLMSSLNHGVDLLGNPIGKQTRFFIGVGMGVGGDDPAVELERVEAKIEKGAHFVITQPVFDTGGADERIAKVRERGVAVIVSIIVLSSFKNAEYLHYEVPGIRIPEGYLARMEEKTGREAEREGVSIARELLSAMMGISDGVLLIVPSGKFHFVEEVLS